MLSPAGNTNEVLMINGTTVSREEFGWFADQERAGVISYCQEKYGATPGKDLWTRQLGKTTAQTLLQNQTIARLTREKVQLLLFQQLGLLEDLSFTAFQANLEKMNRERTEAKARGRVIYGPVNFTPLQFYGHRTASLQLQAKAILARNQLLPAEAGLKKYYNSHRELYRTTKLSSWLLINLRTDPPRDGSPSNQLPATVKALLNKLKSIPDSGNAAPAFDGFDGVKVTVDRYDSLTSDRLGEVFTDEKLFAQVQAVKPGGCVTVTTSENAAQIVKCLSRQPSAARPFTEVRENVRRRWLDEAYDGMLNDLTKQAAIRINRAALDSIPIQ